MGVINSRTPKARALGAAMREQREAVPGMTQRKMAGKMRRDQAMISRWENGERTPDPTEVARYLSILDVPADRYAEIMDMARGVDDTRWVGFSIPEQKAQLAALLKFERTATSLIVVAPLLIPGLLQTGEYVRSIMTLAEDVPASEIDTRVAVRLGRREIFERRPPVRLTALIGEAALRQIVGSREIMARQLEYLLEMAQRPNVDVRVVGFSSNWHPGLEGTFLLINSAEDGPIVHLSMRASAMFLHEPPDVGRYQRAAEVIERTALSPAESGKLIATIAREMG